MNTLATVGATGTWTHRAGESPRGKTAYFAGSFRKLDHLHQFSRQKTPQTEPQTTPCFAGATSNRTTPSGFAVHPSIEGNEPQNASEAGRSRWLCGVSRRKLSGIPKGPLASIQPPTAATQPAAGFFGATVLQVTWSLVAGG